ncbi:bromodomain-containing protein 8-like [Panonychus citri]|uniref:bromodomain-containing protein 8-like n=1 Tax=Panonychus citri TaxID=50023 RepID=UPI002307D1B3|nr:bromodomain-containing protein 8-like [Panonychus citri]
MSTLSNPQSGRGTPSSSTVRPGFRLKQTPIDKWSIREKLALASSVHRSGDQNWYSVSRSLKCFAEPNRPADWFSQKNCALQYSELLENVETPKRKRGERGENTAQDLIVLELQQKRIQELKEILTQEKKECIELKDELDFVKSGSATVDKYREIWERMKREEKEKEIAAEEHEKWLAEREEKIAQMLAKRHLVLVRSPKSPKSSAKLSQATSPAESDFKSKSETPDKSSEPLTVKIEPPSTDTDNSQSTAPHTPTQSIAPQQTPQTPQTPEKTKITPSPVISSPSTSPLLTHLLQSPSPSASGTVPYNILSPSTLKDMQQKTPPSSTHFFPSNITSPTLPRRPMTPLSTSNVTTEQLPSSTIEENKSPVKEIPEPSSTPISGLSSPSASISSPTLSKLLETSPTTTSSVKAILSTSKETESQEISSQDIEMTEIKEDAPEVTEDVHTLPEKIDNETTKAETTIETVIENEIVDISKVDESSQSTINDKPVTIDLNLKNETEPTTSSVTSSIVEVINSVVESYSQESPVDSSTPSEQITAEIKQELIEPKESNEETCMEIDSKNIKIETKTDTDNVPSTPTDSKISTSNNSTTLSAASRKRKRPTPIVTTPSTVPTRRSNRVRTIKDKTSSEEEQIVNTVEEPSSISTLTTSSTTSTTATITTTTTTTSANPTITTTSSTTTTSTITTTPTIPVTTSMATTVTIDTTNVTPLVSTVTVAAASSVGGKKASVSTPSVLPPPPPPLSISTENSAGEESTDNTNITLPPTLIKQPASASTTAPTSKASSVTESAPNSPASAILTAEEIENQKEYKMWKKSIMLLWRQASTHKFSTLFAHPVTDGEAKGYSTVVYRPMDLASIRKKIENGQIKTTAEFQRDMMLMFQNAIMYNSVDHDVHQMAVEMQKEILEGIEDFIETQQKSTSPSTNEPTKPRGRRSNVSTSSDVHDPESAEVRRRKRVSTDIEPAPPPPSTPSSTSKSKTKKKPSN